jgi:molecular chaperone HscC
MSILGIDLGTTNSACCVIQDGQPVQIKNRLGEFLTPSVVSVDDNNKLIVGATAKERLITHPAQSVALFKRIMGTNSVVSIGKHRYKAQELSSFILSSLKEDAEHQLGYKFEKAIISVPAYFNENQRLATKQAAQLAGLEVKRLINEPTAAAMAYGLNDKQQGTFIILDMGGGTFDVSILEYFNGVMEVHASAGDNYLGGEDIVDAMLVQVCKDSGIKQAELAPKDLAILTDKLEMLKCSIKPDTVEHLAFSFGQQQKKITLSYEWFLKIITPFLLRVKKPISQAMNDSNIYPNEIESVILVGGSTRLYAFRQLVAQLFGKLPLCNLNPDLVVSMGAGIQAGLVEKNAALDDIILTDVCPFTLGTEVVNEDGVPGYFLPIIERNTVVPVSIERSVYTVADNQTQLSIKIFQGEHRLVKNNVFLGNLDVNIPKAKAGVEGVTIRYSYDMNGLLDVDVTVIKSGKVFSKTIQNAPGMLNEQQLESAKAKLEKLKFHPRESEQVRQIMARAERIYQQLNGQMRADFGEYVNRFEAIVERQKAAEIERAIAEIKKTMDDVEDRSIF